MYRMTNDYPMAALSITPAELKRRLRDFETEYLKERSEETRGTYRRALHEFERFCNRPEATFGYRAEDVEAYKRYLQEDRGLHHVSISTYLTALRRFCQYLTDIGLLTVNPARAVKGNRRPDSHSRDVLSRGEVEGLLAGIDVSTRIGKRDLAIAYTMIYAGLSEIEIVRANLADLEQTLLGWFLRVQGKGKRSKDRQVPIDAPVMEKVRIYLDARGRIRPENPLFVSHGRRSEGERLNTRSVRSRINIYLKRAGIKREGITPHSLTHTAAVFWFDAGLGVDEVRERLRHGTLDTTLIHVRKKAADLLAD
jgi:integrase/recombinase XerC